MSSIVSVDPAKARSKWMLTDLYGRILVAATEVEPTQACCGAMVQAVRTALEQARIHDQIVVIERTGRYHRPIQRAFANTTHAYTNTQPLLDKPMENLRGVLVMSDGKEIEQFVPLDGAHLKRDEWKSVAIPVEAIPGLKDSSGQIKEIRLAPEAYYD